MAEILAVCISEEKGTQKHPVSEAVFKIDHGIVGDAHAGNWHRQVSLLSWQQVEAFNRRGAGVGDGAFGENLLVDGIDCARLPVGIRLRCGDVLLEVTQIGKECHNQCAIRQRVGDCIMPREGVFARVLRGGELSEGDGIAVVEGSSMAYRVAIITLSDKGARGEREDRSGPAIREMMAGAGYEVVIQQLLSDDPAALTAALVDICDNRRADLVLTTGGTGFSPRDLAPEATLAAIERNVPGIAEAMRARSMQITPRAMLSRGVSGIRGSTLIVNLPGSPKAVRENLEVLLPALEHGLGILVGDAGECGGD
jgi:molybdenum cofactor synthesis domain-containing protein